MTIYLWCIIFGTNGEHNMHSHCRIHTVRQVSRPLWALKGTMLMVPLQTPTGSCWPTVKAAKLKSTTQESHKLLNTRGAILDRNRTTVTPIGEFLKKKKKNTKHKTQKSAWTLTFLLQTVPWLLLTPRHLLPKPLRLQWGILRYLFFPACLRPQPTRL